MHSQCLQASAFWKMLRRCPSPAQGRLDQTSPVVPAILRFPVPVPAPCAADAGFPVWCPYNAPSTSQISAESCEERESKIGSRIAQGSGIGKRGDEKRECAGLRQGRKCIEKERWSIELMDRK